MSESTGYQTGAGREQTNSSQWVRIIVGGSHSGDSSPEVNRVMTVRSFNNITLDVHMINYINPIVRLTVAREPVNFHRTSKHKSPILFSSIRLKKSKPGECSICHNLIRRNTKIPKLYCKHNFHQKCLFKWLQENDTCPICRDRIVEQ